MTRLQLVLAFFRVSFGLFAKAFLLSFVPSILYCSFVAYVYHGDFLEPISVKESLWIGFRVGPAIITVCFLLAGAYVLGHILIFGRELRINSK